MSAKAEELAALLLRRTLEGKLGWRYEPPPVLETYRSDADDGLSFQIKRSVRGDDKRLIWELTEEGKIVLSDTEDNAEEPQNSALLRDQAVAMLLHQSSEGLSPQILQVDRKIKRFRLYSDLFYAARESAGGGDQSAIEKAQEFLAKLA